MIDDILDSDISYMKCDIYEMDDKYHIEIDLPGFKRDNLHIEFNNGCLVVFANKKDINDSNIKNYIKRERTYGVYKREFYVGDIDYTKINAKYKDGVLFIDISKNLSNANKKIIEIK